MLCLFRTVSDLFDYPLLSSEVDIFCVSQLKDTFVVFNLRQVRGKCMRLPLDNSNYAVIPIIHASC